MDDVSKSGDRPAAILTVTSDMIRAGRLGISSEILSWDDASEDERNAAVKAAFMGMLRASARDDLSSLASNSPATTAVVSGHSRTSPTDVSSGVLEC